MAGLVALFAYNAAFMLGVLDRSIPAGEGVTFDTVTRGLHSRIATRSPCR